MSRYNRCKECYNMKCVFVTGEREDFDTSECQDFRPMTNADRIRTMTDEELAEWIVEIADCDEYEEMHGFRMCDVAPGKACEDCWAGWLKDPVEEVDE